MLVLYYIDNKLSRGLIIYFLIFFLDAFPWWFRDWFSCNAYFVNGCYYMLYVIRCL